MTKKNETSGTSGWGIALLLGTFIGLAGDAGAAVKCQLRLGAGCNGPVVYEIQLCAVVTFNQGNCVNLCQGVRPLCNASDFDGWLNAYSKRGRNGYHGDLAETNMPDQFDQSGQLNATSGNTYTVCMSRKTSIFGSYSSSTPASAAVQCPKVVVASDTTCGAGTVFNKDPLNPRCITKDSYCSGGGSTGNYVSTMNAGFQLVAVQNQHFVSAPGEDPNLHNSAATAGTDIPGLTAPLKVPNAAADLNAQTFGSSNPTRRGSSAYGGGTGGAGATGGSAGATTAAATADPNAATGDPSAFAAKGFAMEGSAYKSAGGSAGGAGGTGGAGGSGGGSSWFGGSAAATAGTTSGDVEFAGGAGRGLASDGRLNVEDPENYFLRSDVSVSLFKRVTAQCRKKERSLVLTQIERPSDRDAK